MRQRRILALTLLLVGMAAAPSAALAQGRPDPAKLLAAQREALAKLAFMDGVWRGPASTIEPGGAKHEMIQTERVGPMLDGAVKVVEGRGYDADGSTRFNAFAAVSWNKYTQKYELRSYAQGNAGTFDLTPTDTGYIWEVPAGPGAIVRFTATVTKDTWREVGEYVKGTSPPFQTFEMNLTRVGDTDWPLGAPVTPTWPK